jgi:hypothetical protein
MGVSGQRHAPAALHPRGKNPRYPLDRRLCRLQSRSGRRGYKKNLPLSGIEPRSPDRAARSQTLYCLSYRENTEWSKMRKKRQSNWTEGNWILICTHGTRSGTSRPTCGTNCSQKQLWLQGRSINLNRVSPANTLKNEKTVFCLTFVVQWYSIQWNTADHRSDKTHR